MYALLTFCWRRLRLRALHHALPFEMSIDGTGSKPEDYDDRQQYFGPVHSHSCALHRFEQVLPA